MFFLRNSVPSTTFVISSIANTSSAYKPETTRPTRPPTRPSTIKTTTTPTTTQKDEEEDEEDDDDDDSNNKGNAKNENCPGVCVADRIAEYCEAYLITPGLCKPQSKCCVSRDIYPDKVPVDLRVPTTHTQNQGSSSTQKPIPNVTQSYKENVKVRKP